MCRTSPARRGCNGLDTASAPWRNRRSTPCKAASLVRCSGVGERARPYHRRCGRSHRSVYACSLANAAQSSASRAGHRDSPAPGRALPLARISLSHDCNSFHWAVRLDCQSKTRCREMRRTAAICFLTRTPSLTATAQHRLKPSSSVSATRSAVVSPRRAKSLEKQRKKKVILPTSGLPPRATLRGRHLLAPARSLQ